MKFVDITGKRFGHFVAIKRVENNRHGHPTCCARCNWSKGDQFTYEEWKQIGDLIRSWKN